MRDWQSNFTRRILQRGRAYYEDGAVLHLDKTPEGYSGVVCGSDDYEVNLQVEDGQLLDMSCTCPYAEQGEACKHMAAVLYQITLGEPDLEDAPEPEPTAAELVEALSEEQLRQFLRQLAEENEDIRFRLATLSPQTELTLTQIQQQIEHLLDTYTDRDGFLDYEGAYDCCCALADLLEDVVPILVAQGQTSLAFQATYAALCKLSEQEMDDSDGSFGVVREACLSYWEDWCRNSPEMEQEIFTFLMDKLRVGVNWMIKDVLEGFLSTHFHQSAMLEEKWARHQSLLRQLEQEDKTTSYSYAHEVMNGLAILEELHRDEATLEAYRREHWSVSDIRRSVIDRAIREGDLSTAISVLQESKELDCDHVGLVDGYSEKLVALYEQLGDRSAAKAELEDSLFVRGKTDLALAQHLKQYCSAEDWADCCERLLSRWRGAARCDLLREEERYDQLLEEVLRKGQLYYLDCYEDVLKPYAPERMRDSYIAVLRRSAKDSAGRSVYQEWVRYLKKLSGYPGGEAAARTLAAEWKETYRRRRAMIEELEKGGF